MEERNNSHALSGMKILDFSSTLPGPMATMMLADMGAEVIKIVTSKRPDFTETNPPFIPDTDLSAGLAWIGRNKKVLTLNLKSSKAADIVKELIKEYDIVIEQFRPGAMSRLGLGYEDLKKINPKLIYCSITNFGQKSCLANAPAHDINSVAMSGVASYSGRVNGGPPPLGIQLGDVPGGSYSCIMGVLMAYIYRMNTGIGQHVDCAMTDGVFSLNARRAAEFLVSGVSPMPETTYNNGGTVYDYYECKDGKYVAIGTVEHKFFDPLCDMIGMPQLKELNPIKPVSRQIKDSIRATLRTKTRDEWMEVISNGPDTCFTPVMNMEEAYSTQYAKERELFIEVEGPNGQTIRQPGYPIKFSITKPEVHWIGKQMKDSDTVEILKSLGYNDEQIKTLTDEEVLV